MFMGFIVTLIFLCLFLIIAVYIYYKEKSEQLIINNNKGNMKIDKAHSPYIITPEQKITQQLLAAQTVTSIECSAKDIAHLLRYMALYGEFRKDEVYRTPRTLIRLVTRAKTKFDEDDVKKEQEAAVKSFGSKLDLHTDQQSSTLMRKARKRVQQQDTSNSKPEKKARRNELSDKMNYDSGAKRYSRGFRLQGCKVGGRKDSEKCVPLGKKVVVISVITLRIIITKPIN
uniref:SWIB domain-containing protein n=1 Tax=Elaeophora elaphi TaxID=1147741 RepID=A0A0R3S240_9BILA